jgi:hypothetical protein
MGLFFNSEVTNKKNQILSDVAIINQSLRQIANILDNQGVNGSSNNLVNQTLNSIEVNITRTSNNIQSMSDSQLDGFNVPWMDGRYIGIMTYLMSFSTMLNKIEAEFKRF